jgi:hypothetical protein
MDLHGRGIVLECVTIIEMGTRKKKNNIKGLTAARMSSSTADIPSEPLREIAPDARRRS